MNSNIRLYSYWLVIPALLLYCVFFIFPMLAGFFYSFTDWSPVKNTLSFNGWENFRYIFRNDVTRLAIKNTLIYAVVVVIFKNLFGLLLAVALNTGLKTRNVLRAVYYAPAIVSTIVIGLVFIPILHPNGLLNQMLTRIGLEALTQYWLVDRKIVILTIAAVSIWQWSGYHMAIYLAGLQGISGEYFEAAKIDGANAFQRFRHITIPLMAASININVILSLIGGIRVFSEVYALTNGGPGNASQVLSTYILVLFGEGRWGLGTAMNTVLFLFVALVSIPLLYKMRKQEVEA